MGLKPLNETEAFMLWSETYCGLLCIGCNERPAALLRNSIRFIIPCCTWVGCAVVTCPFSRLATSTGRKQVTKSSRGPRRRNRTLEIGRCGYCSAPALVAAGVDALSLAYVLPQRFGRLSWHSSWCTVELSCFLFSVRRVSLGESVLIVFLLLCQTQVPFYVQRVPSEM